ncbi:MAG: hypothetical protein ACI8SR_001749 [Oceanicoccus sp.]|jgi:hypothetical protein
MAAIPYRIYLLFSALIPAFIYSFIAAILVGLLSLRVNETDGLGIALFFTALCFTACFRMTKDLWSTWPYAIFAKKFKVDSEDEKKIEGKATYKGYLERPLLVSFMFAAVSSSLVFLISYYAVPYAFGYHLSILWLVGACIFPIILFVSLLVASDIFYRSYDRESARCKNMTIKEYVARFYLYPESLCFLLLNFSIINPLGSIQQATFDVAWVTMLVTISITTLLLLMSAHSNPIYYVVGGLNSKLINITDREKFNFKINKKDIKESYKVSRFSLIGWWALIVFIQVVMVTVFIKNVESWFYPFLFSAQVVWMVSYFYLRNSMLLGSVKQVIKYHGREDLQQGYMDLSESQKVPV